MTQGTRGQGDSGNAEVRTLPGESGNQEFRLTQCTRSSGRLREPRVYGLLREAGTGSGKLAFRVI